MPQRPCRTAETPLNTGRGRAGLSPPGRFLVRMFDDGRVQQWVRRWKIRDRWERAAHSPFGVTVVEEMVATPAELRRIVQAARADPHVIALPYESVRVLEGAEPETCRNGHSYGGGSATRPRRDWLDCPCGGHHLLVCAWPGCGDRQLSPGTCAELQ